MGTHAAQPSRVRTARPPAPAPWREPFRPDIEGLRAVAVLAVVGFHAGLPGFAGGYVGVDIFFVISGYLITRMLWQEWQATGSIALAAFYGRRARRLLPAAVLVLLATVLTSVYVLPPLRAHAVLTDALAALFYAGNYRFAVQGTDYLASTRPPSPLQHYWSLGVEEQFYLLWPALLLGALLLGRLRSARTDLRRCVLVLAVLAVSSFLLSWHWTRTLPAWAFFSAFSRAWELAAGGLLALLLHRLDRLPRSGSLVLGWLGMATILGSVLLLDSATAFPGSAALYPVLGAVAVLAAGDSDELGRGSVRTVLGWPPLRGIGRLSYSWYLWHWPFLLLAPAVIGHRLGLSERLATVLLSALAALITLVCLENPVRFAPALRRRGLALAGALSCAGLCGCLLCGQLIPSTVGRGAAAAPLRIGAPVSGSAAQSSRGGQGAASPVVRMQAQVQAALSAALAHHALPVNLQPTLAAAASDKAQPFFDGCLSSWTAPEPADCYYADLSAARTVLLMGDSHAAQWLPAVDAAAKQRGWRLQFQGKSACPPLDTPIFSPYLGRPYTECAQWLRDTLNDVRTERPALVVLGVARHYDPSYDISVYGPAWLTGLARTVRELQAAGTPVLVLGPIPKPRSDVPTCLSAHLDDISRCTLPRDPDLSTSGVVAEQAAVTAAGGHYLDLSPLFCTATRCPVVVGNDLVYRDDNHITTSYAQVMTPLFSAELSTLMAAAPRH
jgi:peptidoglycan/LPS O-acetylase OafA/YrhL